MRKQTAKAKPQGSQRELLKRALATIPTGLPPFGEAFQQRIDDEVDQFVKSFYRSGIGPKFKSGPSAHTNDARKDNDAIDEQFQLAMNEEDWDRAYDAYHALNDHIADELAATEDAYYYLGLAVGLRAAQGVLPVGNLNVTDMVSLLFGKKKGAA